MGAGQAGGTSAYSRPAVRVRSCLPLFSPQALRPAWLMRWVVVVVWSPAPPGHGGVLLRADAPVIRRSWFYPPQEHSHRDGGRHVQHSSRVMVIESRRTYFLLPLFSFAPVPPRWRVCMGSCTRPKPLFCFCVHAQLYQAQASTARRTCVQPARPMRAMMPTRAPACIGLVPSDPGPTQVFPGFQACVFLNERGEMLFVFSRSVSCPIYEACRPGMGRHLAS